jgi:amino acid transporter
VAASAPALKKNAIGMWQIVFFVIAAAAPLTGMLGIIPVAIRLGNGAGVPGAFVAAGLILLVFSVGYAAMSRHVVNAGAFYAYLAQGLGRSFGVGGAFVAVISYTTMQVGVYALFGFFATVILNPLLSLPVPWYAYSAVAIALVQFLGMRKLDLSGWVLGLFITLEWGFCWRLACPSFCTEADPRGLICAPSRGASWSAGIRASLSCSHWRRLWALRLRRSTGKKAETRRGRFPWRPMPRFPSS